MNTQNTVLRYLLLRFRVRFAVGLLPFSHISHLKSVQVFSGATYHFLYKQISTAKQWPFGTFYDVSKTILLFTKKSSEAKVSLCSNIRRPECYWKLCLFDVVVQMQLIRVQKKNVHSHVFRVFFICRQRLF